MPIARRKLGLKTAPCKKDIELPCFVIFNHISDYDFIPVVDIFRPYTRYVASDAIVRGKKRFLVKMACDFIFRRKGERADDVIKSAKVTLDKGISVSFAAEGEESPNGETAPIRVKTGKMIKEAGYGFVTVRLVGGYFIRPSWCRNDAKGPSFGDLVGIYTKEQVAEMSVEEINETIHNDLYVNHYEWNREKRIPYERECRAEWMERILYTCPKCGKMCTMKSERDDLFCTDCGYRVSVDECGFFVGDDVIFDNLHDWDVWQRDRLRANRQMWIDNPDYVITSADHQKLRVAKNDTRVELDDDVRIEMTSKAITITGKNTNMVIPLEEIISIVRSRGDSIGISYNGQYYLVKSMVPAGCRRYRTILKILRNEYDA